MQVFKLPFDFKSFPSELRYLHWDGYPSKYLPLAFFSEKLVEICLRDSDVQKLWDGVQDLVNLKKIDFSQSKQLTELPDFSKARNLEVVELSYCKSLCSVHPSILSCDTLVSLYLNGCKELKSLQSEIHFQSLKDLRVGECYNLKEFSLSSEKIRSLGLYDTKIEMLHSSFGLFKVLSELYLNGSTLKSLPINELRMLTSLNRLLLRDFKQEISKTELSILFDALPNLERLKLDGCMKLLEIPDNISALSRLTYLSLDKSGVETLPSSIKLLSNLHMVNLKDGRRLRCLPELPPSITCLDFSRCTSLETLPASIKHLSKLEEVRLKNCRRLECLPELPPSIARLDCMGCRSLVTLPSSIKHLSNLEKVCLKNCRRLECLPELPPTIERLDCKGCKSLVTLPSSIKHLSKLEQVCLKNCRRFECLPELAPSITWLDVRGCTSLERVQYLAPVNDDQRPRSTYFSFLGCMKMDEQSLRNAMEFSHISMMRPPNGGRHGGAHVCYAGSAVPKWLKYKETEKASITIECAPSSRPLLGLVCCCVLSPSPFNSGKSAKITCNITGFNSTEWAPYINLKELNTDNVFLWNCKLSASTTSNLEFQFSLHECHDEAAKGLIKACGVCPIYASSQINDSII